MSFADVDSAVRLQCFDIDSRGCITVSPVIVEPWFLNSRTFAHRLLLNALTSPHVFLGGDAVTYERHRKRAEHALAVLAVALLGGVNSFTLEEAVAAVTHGPEQASGEDFLGYIGSRHLYTILLRGLSRLARHGILRRPGRTRFELDHAAFEAVIRLLRPARGPGAPAWDNARREGGFTQ
ncbi:hypothetical protein H0B56_02380 [Haloechinothrix sp. YIM 98757]|uniref:Uncharacterized protein n=1 Tax=Haloechinothrix aidingensis TaxID=2752311 RepID=A0A837ZW98_9PSEU|nr:hypothetical protein [Haloechinothrix aidingensis]MBA0124384.1 hypothetical protein [Haloechinothrix aidingensis]